MITILSQYLARDILGVIISVIHKVNN